MGILPIGFFSPLPLAMMIPFMATQSLAMGEAFGKSFQYGKRKISSMTNEEFNKLTFQDLMTEQTANIRAIIPELKQQMSMSKDMQKAIFQEMIQLIPTFFESFKKSLPSDVIETSSQASPLPEIQNIRYTTDRDFELQQQRIDDALKLFNDNFLKQAGTKEELAEKLAGNIVPPPLSTTTQTELTPAMLAKAKALREDEIWTTWALKLGSLKTVWTKSKRDYESCIGQCQGKTGSQRVSCRNNCFHFRSDQRDASQKIRQMSNDYRNPNNNIRTNALALRKHIASGQWN